MPYTINGTDRIADGMTRKVLTEVKNVREQSLTEQLRDAIDYARATGRKVDLYTRSDTKLTGPLKRAINEGLLNHKFIPGT